MNQAISVELQFFLVSIIWGALLLLVYDMLRILRRLIKHGEFLVAMEDLIFWVCASLFIFVMMYKENNGIIRGFSIMGMAIGIIIYHFAISELLVGFLTKLIKILLTPLVFVVKQLEKTGKLVTKWGKKAISRMNKRLKKHHQSVRIKLSAKKQVALAKRQKKQQERQAKKKISDDIKQTKRKAKGKEKRTEQEQESLVQGSKGQQSSKPRRVVDVRSIPLNHKR